MPEGSGAGVISVPWTRRCSGTRSAASSVGRGPSDARSITVTVDRMAGSACTSGVLP